MNISKGIHTLFIFPSLSICVSVFTRHVSFFCLFVFVLLHRDEMRRHMADLSSKEIEPVYVCVLSLSVYLI